MRKWGITALTALFLSACGVIMPWPPDFEGRSRQVQMLAFGRELVNSGHFMIAHESPDQRTLTWLYRIEPRQNAELSRRCIRAAEATDPYRPFRSGPRRTVPGCMIWQGGQPGSRVKILISDTTFEIQETTDRPIERGW